jgi:hypothetical protein
MLTLAIELERTSIGSDEIPLFLASITWPHRSGFTHRNSLCEESTLRRSDKKSHFYYSKKRSNLVTTAPIASKNQLNMNS